MEFKGVGKFISRELMAKTFHECDRKTFENFVKSHAAVALGEDRDWYHDEIDQRVKREIKNEIFGLSPDNENPKSEHRSRGEQILKLNGDLKNILRNVPQYIRTQHNFYGVNESRTPQISEEITQLKNALDEIHDFIDVHPSERGRDECHMMVFDHDADVSPSFVRNSQRFQQFYELYASQKSSTESRRFFDKHGGKLIDIMLREREGDFERYHEIKGTFPWSRHDAISCAISLLPKLSREEQLKQGTILCAESQRYADMTDYKKAENTLLSLTRVLPKLSPDIFAPQQLREKIHEVQSNMSGSFDPLVHERIAQTLDMPPGERLAEIKKIAELLSAKNYSASQRKSLIPKLTSQHHRPPEWDLLLTDALPAKERPKPGYGR